MRASLRPVLLLTLLLSVAACGARSRGAATPAPRTTVRVENQGFLDMNVYVLRGTQRIRLGNVPGLSTRSLTIPSNLVFGTTTLRFLADPIGSDNTPISQEIQVVPGDEVVLYIRGQ